MSSYWCHKCRRRCTVERYDDVRCGTCHEGFVEEQPNEVQFAASSRDDQRQRSMGSPPPRLVLEGDANPFDSFPGSPFARIFQQIHELHGHGVPGAPPPPVPMEQNQHNNDNQQGNEHHQPQQQQNNVDNNDLMTMIMNQVIGPFLNRTQMENTGGRTQLIIQLGGGDGEQPGGAGFFNVHGNLEDYAWGEHGLDNVLTALLNTFDGAQQQMRSLRPEDIAKLPMSKVTQKQVDNGTQCTTCMETFQLDETVAKLDCDHIFHSDCLKPWLARNNTCPICRTEIDPSKWGPTISDVDELD